MRDEFEAWARVHLGQGYPLTIEDHVYVSPVTRWAFKAWKAATEAAAKKHVAALEGAASDGQIEQNLEDMLAVRPFPHDSRMSYWLTPDEIRELFGRLAAAAIRGKGE